MQLPTILESPGRAPAHAGAASVRSPALELLAQLAGEYTLPHILRRVAGGQRAVWGGGSWEAPLLYAAGVLPVGINELWREQSREAEAVGENEFQIPAEYCSMIKAVLGRLRLIKDQPIKRIIHFGGACEPISIALELTRGDGYELFCIEGVTAFKQDERQLAVMTQLLVAELERLALWLTGAAVDEDRLRHEIERKNRISKKLRRVLELRVAHPHHLPSLATLQLLAGAAHYFGQPDRYEQAIDRIALELEALTPSATPSRAIPIVFAGGGAAGFDVFRAIESSGGVVLGFVTFNSLDRTYREDVPPLESIARYLLDSQIAGELGELGGAPALPRRHRIEEAIRRTGARGIVASGVTGCPYNSIVQQVEREHFKKLGIPMIALETTVHREPPTEEQLIKLETFVEMLS
ncbi:MAG: 2-hydroxyacyl-CoA dehydratase [Opitutaceae bacterium]|nr:2-hydroxyacyl-CoA dehydratase [Opitutaceae bacterium]